MIKAGNFFFRHRNRLFPVIMIGLFMLAVPPSQIFHREIYEHIKDILALAIALAGLTLRGMVIGYAYIKRGGMNKKVYAENLVTEGLFGICRNPLYAGNMLIYTGVFLMHGNPLVMAIGIGVFFFIYRCIIRAEETYLREKFGDGYLAYCTDVPRWIPRFSRLRDTTEGMRFNFRRVILKDYSTIATTLVTLAIIEEYEYLALPDYARHLPYIEWMAAAIVLAVVAAIAIRVLKKRKWLTEAA